jgi:hypothetical protein
LLPPQAALAKAASEAARYATFGRVSRTALPRPCLGHTVAA